MHPAEATSDESLGSAGQTILIVDDTPTNLEVVGALLSQHGFQVMVALNGELGLSNTAHSICTNNFGLL